MNILVTGSSGRIGSAISENLSADNDVCGVDLLPGKYTSLRQNILSSDSDSLIAEADAIIHCAALHAPHVNDFSDQAFWDANVETTKKLLSLSRYNTPFVLTSSTSIFGDSLDAGGEVVWVDETLPAKPRDIYDRSKLAAEALLEQACVSGRPGTVLRMSRCFPEDERLMALYRSHRGVDTRDVVQAHKLALKRKSGFACYVVSGPTPFKEADIRELNDDSWRCLLRYYPDLVDLFEQRGWKQRFSPDRVYSSELAQREMAYKPRYGIMEFLTGDRQPAPLL